MSYIYVNLKKTTFLHFNKIIRKNTCLCSCDGRLYDFSLLRHYPITHYLDILNNDSHIKKGHN